MRNLYGECYTHFRLVIPHPDPAPLSTPCGRSEGGARHSLKARIPLAIGAGDGEGRRRSRGVRYQTTKVVLGFKYVYLLYTQALASRITREGEG